MKQTAQVVIIGGGVVGCSILYHLAKNGWTDCLLVERQELTSGSSWHAAGGLFTVTRPNAVAEIHRYTFQIYPELEKQSGQSCGFHHTGGLNLCRNHEEMDFMRTMQGACRRLGIESEFISLDEIKQKAPIVDTTHLVGALWEEEGGHVDPAGVTHAFAAAAKKLGARVSRFDPVIETNQLENGHWQVVTENTTIEAEYLVNAAGLWGREVASMANITLPLVPVEHHYLVTEEMPDIKNMAFELPQINDGETNCYVRQEGQGILLGAYETPCIHWSKDRTPDDFGHELLPDDLSRLEWHFEKAIELMPSLATAGVKRVINGPMIFSPDLGPLLGPHPALTNYFCANGVMTGFNQGAGIGRVMAEWIIDGEPPFDIFCWDVARYGDWATREYMHETTRYFYEHRSDRVYPNQEYQAGRPLKTPPVYEKLRKAGAVFGMSFGLEHPLWFAKPEQKAVDSLTFKQPNWWGNVADECLKIRNQAGLFEFSAMAKFDVTGKHAQQWLNYVLANRMPDQDGKVILSPMLNENGNLIGDFSISRLSQDHYFVLGADTMQLAFMRHFKHTLPYKDVKVTNRSDQLAGLHIAGPAAQEIISSLADADLSTATFPFMHASKMTIADAEEVTVIRVSFTGECGYELYCRLDQQNLLYDALMLAGQKSGLCLVGTRALMMTRLEKSFPAWGTELSPDYTAFDAGVEQFVALDKDSFIGKKAALQQSKRILNEQRVTLTVEAGDAAVWGDEAIFKNTERVGYVSSAGYGAWSGQHIALGYLLPDAVDKNAEYMIEILGKMKLAKLQIEPIYDPEGKKMRD